MEIYTQKVKYVLEERTLAFSKKILKFCKTLPQDVITKPLLSQLVRSATSVGANYAEANGASSKKDFANKVFIYKKEAKETMYWLTLLGSLFEDRRTELTFLYKESKELTLIFSKISSSSRKQD